MNIILLSLDSGGGGAKMTNTPCCTAIHSFVVFSYRSTIAEEICESTARELQAERVGYGEANDTGKVATVRGLSIEVGKASGGGQ